MLYSPFNLSANQTINVAGNGGTDTFTISGGVPAVLNGTGGTNLPPSAATPVPVR